MCVYCKQQWMHDRIQLSPNPCHYKWRGSSRQDCTACKLTCKTTDWYRLLPTRRPMLEGRHCPADPTVHPPMMSRHWLPIPQDVGVSVEFTVAKGKSILTKCVWIELIVLSRVAKTIFLKDLEIFKMHHYTTSSVMLEVLKALTKSPIMFLQEICVWKGLLGKCDWNEWRWILIFHENKNAGKPTNQSTNPPMHHPHIRTYAQPFICFELCLLSS